MYRAGLACLPIHFYLEPIRLFGTSMTRSVSAKIPIYIRTKRAHTTMPRQTIGRPSYTQSRTLLGELSAQIFLFNNVVVAISFDCKSVDYFANVSQESEIDFVSEPIKFVVVVFFFVWFQVSCTLCAQTNQTTISINKYPVSVKEQLKKVRPIFSAVQHN